MIKDKQIRAAAQLNITLEGTSRGIDVGERSPPRTGCSTEGNRDAGQTKAMGKKFAGIEHLAPTGGEDGITTGSFKGKTLQIVLTTVVVKCNRQRIQGSPGQILSKLMTEGGCGARTSKHSRATAEISNSRQG